MNYLDLDIPERQGIYLFILPDLKVGYVGSSNNLKRRYLEHIGGTKGGNKVIKDQVDRENKVEYMILEFCDGYSTEDLKLIESNWIKHFRLKGLKLINVSEPTKEPIYGEPKAIVAYNAKTLEFVGEYASTMEAGKKLKVGQAHISLCALENKDKKGGTTYSVKGNFIFYKNDFSEEKLLEKKEKYLKALASQKKAQSSSGKLLALRNKKLKSKKIIQYSKTGEFIKIWDSVMEAARSLNISPPNISKCCRERRKSTGGYVWRYAESEETN